MNSSSGNAAAGRQHFPSLKVGEYVKFSFMLHEPVFVAGMLGKLSKKLKTFFT